MFTVAEQFIKAHLNIFFLLLSAWIYDNMKSNFVDHREQQWMLMLRMLSYQVVTNIHNVENLAGKDLGKLPRKPKPN